MKRINIIITFLIIFNSIIGYCQQKVSPNFIFRGDLYNEEGARVDVKYYQCFGLGMPPTEEVYSTVKNQKFQLAMSGVTSPGYLQFRLDAKDGSGTKALGMTGIFYVEPRDSIVLKWEGGKPVYYGRGSAKFNFRIELKVAQEEFVSNYGRKETKQELLLMYDSLAKQTLKILQKYKNEISREAYEILELDYKSEAIKKIVWNLLTTGREIDIPSFFRENRALFSVKPSVSRPDHSDNYTKYLFLKEKLLVVSNPEFSSMTEDLQNNIVFRNIIKNYQSHLRDKLLVLALSLDLGDSINMKRHQALRIVKSPEYEKTIKSLENKFAKGEELFPFTFENLQGERVSKASLKGKVVVLEFYFLGCLGCAKLSKDMTPVIHEFKDNPNVVFLAVNIDKQKEVFQKAVNTGLYTHPESTNVYTSGLGEMNPVYKYYGFRGAPYLLLMDRKGKILYENPPLPGNEKNTQKFIEIIKKGLEEK